MALGGILGRSRGAGAPKKIVDKAVHMFSSRQYFTTQKERERAVRSPYKVGSAMPRVRKRDASL